MGLNNNGWSLGREVFYIIIFVICLVIAIIGIIRMNLFMGDTPAFDNDTFDYNLLEIKLVNASKNYIDNKDKVSNKEIIKSSLLINEGYMNDLKDGVGEECSGYVEATVDEVIEYKAYVSCFNYTTAGYDSKKD